ncbi:uncharacterized protein LOC110686542 [Chenopodium quinoa]|uniref:uncharacterized protein LOC110686542 n=1 Tax=Chenopodium quinoa TaxID=63459 RepID=UPI000B77BDEF|nr:uncharacterized protein LOC110686542 [Chenopodium quinoa]
MAVSHKKFNEVMTHNKMLENPIYQLANALKENVIPSSLPSQGLDPKRPMNAIVTRTGKVLEESFPKNNRTTEGPKEVLVEDERNGASLSEVVIETPREVRVEREILKPKLPYQQKFMRHKLDEQFGRFIDILKQLHFSLPFTKVVTQMPNYKKFLKDILSCRRSCDVVETVNLAEICSAIIMNKMLPKLKDLGNFSIPCAINKMQIDNTLCDLGASVSLMPYLVYQRLELGELMPSKITLQFADRSIKIPKGMVEDVLLRVGKFVIPADFVVLEMDEDATIPIILGRPFLFTSGAMIDVKSAKFSLKVGDKDIEFDLNESMKYPCSSIENCMLIDSLDLVVSSMHDHLLTSNDPLENVLLNKDKIGSPIKEVAMYEDLLNGSVEEVDEHICMNISSQEALQAATLKEAKGVPMVELKTLTSHLRYEFLGPNSTFSVIVSSSLSKNQAQKLCDVLRKHQGALGYSIDDLKGISPAFCTHHITIEEGTLPSIERQRKIHPQMGEVVKKEITKLLDAVIIFPISNSRWVSPIHVLPKKGGMTVVENEKGIVLGLKISHKDIEVDKAKIEVIEKLPPPINVKGVRSFLGHIGFYRRFIKDFSLIAKPFNDLLQKDVEFAFDDKCLEAFKKLKKAPMSTPIVQAPRWDLPLELMCDVSDSAIGGVLGQRDYKKLHVIYYISKTLNGAQRNNTTMEKEYLAIVHAFEKFHCYLLSSKTIIFTDHEALKYLFTKKESKSRSIRWVLKLKTFDIEIRDKRGAENIVADHLSRLDDSQIHDDGSPIEDNMLDDFLYAI